MNIRCHGCGRVFRVRQDRLPAAGARTRCPRCREVLVIPPVQERPATPASPPGGRVAEEALFDLPPAELGLEEQDGDLFGLGEGGQAPSQPAAEPTPDFATPPEAAPPEARPRGFRGWLARLFGSDS